tara:strand:+ start:386 stop:577 length:192 start_codon:yes stop_codon:yes gene_type:complete
MKKEIMNNEKNVEFTFNKSKKDLTISFNRIAFIFFIFLIISIIFTFKVFYLGYQKIEIKKKNC